MPKRKRIRPAELLEMLNGMAMLLDWQGQLLQAARAIIEDAGAEAPPPRPRRKPPQRKRTRKPRR
jgi:hypothetical protein